MMAKVLLLVSLMILDLVLQVMEEQHIHHLLMILIIQLLQAIQLQLFQLLHTHLFLHREDMEHLHLEVILLQVDLLVALDIQADQQVATELQAVDMERLGDLVLQVAQLLVVLPHMELQALQQAMAHQAHHQGDMAPQAQHQVDTALQAHPQEDIVLRVLHQEGMELQVHLEDLDIQVAHREVMELHHHLQQDILQVLLPAIQVHGDHQEDHQLVATELLLALVVQLLVLEDMGMPHLHLAQHQVIHPQAQVGIQQPHIQLIHQVLLKLLELLK